MKSQPRTCGECSVCCFVGEVKEGVVQKPACAACPFLNQGCTLYGKPERPQVCKDFQCSWLRGYGQDGDRPDKSGVMVSVNQMNGGTWINVMELKPNAHRTTGKSIVLDVATKVDLPVIVVKHSNLKHGKGDYAIVKKSLLPRSQKLIGDHLGYLDDGQEFGIYQLIVNKPVYK